MIINPFVLKKNRYSTFNWDRGISEASVIDNKEPTDWFVNQDTLEVLSTD